ncbi:MAG: lycopene cyclase domain-containing protein [Parcubacteria group bacterium]
MLITKIQILIDTYTYIIGCLIIFSVWIIIYFLRKNIRREMIWAGLAAAPFGVTEILWVPEYWNPPSLFNLIRELGFGIEDFMYMFLLGSLASVVYEFIERKKLVKTKRSRYLHLLPILISLASFLALELIFSDYSVYSAVFSLFLGAGVIYYIRKDLRIQILFGSIIFGILYIFLFYIFTFIFPDYIAKYYTLENFLGIYILSVPIEELLIGLSMGAFWSSIYEFVRDYKVR